MDLERGARRTVRCGLHGRFYDSWSSRGCPDCAKGAHGARSGRRGAWSALLLLLAGGAGLVHWQGDLHILTNSVRVEPVAAPRRPPPPRADRLEVQALERFAGALAPLLADGRQEMLAIGEPVVDGAESSPDQARLAQDWQAFVTRWEEQVALACGEAPPPPARDGDPHVLLAHQLLGDACQQLRSATVAAGETPVPMKSWREGSLAQAAARIDEARAQLEAATRF